MKKIFIVILFICSTALFGENFSIGLRAGANFSHLIKVDGQLKPGFTGGLTFEYLLNHRFSIQSETLFSMEGCKLKSDNTFLNLYYINWPIMLKIYPTDRFYLTLGPQLKFLVGGKGGVLPRNRYKIFDISATAGLGFYINSSFYLDGRYSIGFLDISDSVYKGKNSSFQFSVGYTFY